MSKRTVFTNLTPLPAGISRECVMETLRSHTEMIDLNPLVEERHPIKPPSNATAEEYHCIWYSLTDRVQYLPGGLASGKVTYTCCFHDLQNGLQTHCYAPMGLNIKGKWTLGGSLPGEPVPPVELGLGAPLQGLWLREDVDMKCNFMMTSFVKKTLQKAHSKLVDRLLVKAQIQDASLKNQELYSSKTTEYSPSEYNSSISDIAGDDSSTSFPNSAYRNTATPPTIINNSSIGSFRPLELSHINENGNTGLGLNPPTSSPPPSNRGSHISNHSNSSNHSNNNRLSYQDPQQAYNQRVSWQNLNLNQNQNQNQGPPYPIHNPRSPSMHTINPSYQNQTQNQNQIDQHRTSYQPPPPQFSQQQPQLMTYLAELHSEERVEPWRGTPHQNQNQNPLSSHPPPQPLGLSGSGAGRGPPASLEPGRQLGALKGFPVELE